MDGFIAGIASSLYDRYGDGLSDLVFVFPSRRARLFFVDALSRRALRPMWQPEFTTVDELMQRASGVAQSDRFRLITELYRIYSRYHNESFDLFYRWGDLLLSDFDAIDKYLIDADMLFANVSDLRALEDDFSYLTPEQVQVITQFWRNFGLDSGFSQEKENFITVWRSLAAIYHEFRETLLAQGMAYTGMVYRLAAGNLRGGGAGVLTGGENKRYIIAGFNALSECEKVLFDWMKKSGRAEFYWDYDNYYVGNRDHEAGAFLRSNILNYPPPDTAPTDHDHFAEPKEIVAVSAPSDSLQCKYVHTFLQELIDRGEKPGKETAIVLTDESLLLPVLYSIPEGVEKVNVTMGYPLRQTTAYSFMERLMELQNRSRSKGEQLLFYHSDVTGIMNHPYLLEQYRAAADDITAHIKRRQQVYVPRDMLQVGGVAERIFRPVEGWRELSAYLQEILAGVGRHPVSPEEAVRRREFFTVLIDNLCQLENSLADCGLDISVPVYVSLLRKVLQDIRIPYEGEPLDGIQVMGILETRNLDFKNLLVLSVNDDTFPGNRAVSSSFIPYSLRIGYGLPTPLDHESVYGYYFYRLIQRAERIHLAYCSRSDEKRTGEPSRYIYQLRYESPHPVRLVGIPLNVSLSQPAPVVVEKGGEVFKKLSAYLQGGDKELSPTGLNAYVECPLKFYFRYIAGLRPEDEVTEEIDLPMFGTILHKAMELLYAGLTGVPDPGERIAALRGTPAVDAAVRRAINQEYLHEPDAGEAQYGGNVLLVRDIVRQYINTCILPYDAARSGFTVLELEKKISCPFRFGLPGAGRTVMFGGLADRIDRLGSGIARVVDYKTGSSHQVFRDLDSLFSAERRERSGAVLQTLLYALMLYTTEHCDVQPALYYVRQMNRPDYSPLLIEGNRPVERFSEYYQPLREHLDRVLTGLFDPRVPFVQCADVSTCEYCDFREICRR